MRVLKLAGFMLVAILCGAFGGVVKETADYQYGLFQDRQAAHAMYAQVAHDMALADYTVGSGSPFVPATSYSACTDPGGMICLVNGQFQVANPALEGLAINAATLLNLNYTAGGGTIANTNTNATAFGCSATVTSLCYTFAAPASGTGATVGIAGATPISLTADATGALTMAANTPSASNAGLLLTSTDATNCGAGQANIALLINNQPGTALLTVKCNGTVTSGAAITSPTVVTGQSNNAAIVASAGNIQAQSTTIAKGQILAGNASADANITGGAFAVGSGGFYEQGTNCAQTTTNASPSLVTLTQWMCKLTSGSAAATVFTITYPGSVTLGNAPMCIVQDLASIVTEPTCTTTATTATLTYGSAPGTVAFAYIWLVGNGP